MVRQGDKNPGIIVSHCLHDPKTFIWIKKIIFYLDKTPDKNIIWNIQFPTSYLVVDACQQNEKPGWKDRASFPEFCAMSQDWNELFLELWGVDIWNRSFKSR